MALTGAGRALCPTPTPPQTCQMVYPDCPLFPAACRPPPMGPSFQPWERGGLSAASSQVRPQELMDPRSAWHWLGAPEACPVQAPHLPDEESRPRRRQPLQSWSGPSAARTPGGRTSGDLTAVPAESGQEGRRGGTWSHRGWGAGGVEGEQLSGGSLSSCCVEAAPL